jgi:hypothetical protein
LWQRRDFFNSKLSSRKTAFMPNKRLRKSEEGDKYLKPSSKKFRAPKESEQDPAEVEEVIAAFKQLNKVQKTHSSSNSHFLLSLLNLGALVRQF